MDAYAQPRKAIAVLEFDTSKKRKVNFIYYGIFVGKKSQVTKKGQNE